MFINLGNDENQKEPYESIVFYRLKFWIENTNSRTNKVYILNSLATVNWVDVFKTQVYFDVLADSARYCRQDLKLRNDSIVF